jgi:uncharacterized membrane protein YtjA (UPF0391 family)
MLSFAMLFLVLAVVAAVFGFSGLAGDLVGIAWFLFVAFVVLFIVVSIANAIAGRRTPTP